MRHRGPWKPKSVQAPDEHSYHFQDKWRAHHGRQRRARQWKLAGGRVEWVRLPPRHDPLHPRGILVGRAEAALELRVYLGFERLDPEATWRSPERLYLDTSALSADPTEDRRRQRGRDIHNRRELVGGLGRLAEQARVWFACREDSRDHDFASPYDTRWHRPIP